MTEKCKICNLFFISKHSLTGHVRNKHYLSKKEYYDLYLKKETEGSCALCKQPTTFRGNRYLKYCSQKCFSNCPTTKKHKSRLRTGTKQSREVIEKRIKNTNQLEKENTRKITMLKKYGVDNCAKLDTIKKKISDGNRGKKKPRTKEHQRKIIEAKIKNNTTKHSKETKEKIKNSLIKLYQSDDAPVTLSQPKTRHKTGYLNELYYRSSYEKRFIQYCFDNSIRIQSAENKNFRIKYINEDGKQKYYYPDFYLPDYDLIIEIKPLSLLDYNSNTIKIAEAMTKHSMILINEEELNDLDDVFKYL